MDPTTTTPNLLRLILDQLLPLLLVSSLSVSSLVSPWRRLHSHLESLLHTLSTLSISYYSSSTAAEDNKNDNDSSGLLLRHLLPSLHSTLLSLHALSLRCSLGPQPSSKLLLQSDLHIASSLLHSHLRDLNLLLNCSNTSSAALVLSSATPDPLLFINDAFARIQIVSDIQLKHQALHSLHQLLADNPTKISLLIAQQLECETNANNKISLLLRLLDPTAPNHSLLLRDQAAAIVAVLATASDVSRRVLFEEGALGPMLRLLDSGSAAVKEHAATAIEAITADRGNAWAVSAYGGIGILISACGEGGGSPPAVSAMAAGALRNVAVVEDLRAAMIEEGAITVLTELIGAGNNNNNNTAVKNSLICVWLLASEGDDATREKMLKEGSLQKLVHLILESTDIEILEHGLRAIKALSCYAPAARAAACYREFFVQLSELITVGNAAVQQIAACLISSLNPNEECKRLMAGCMHSMIKMLELPKPANVQQVAGEALVCLLEARSNRVELGRDAKSLTKLVQMLDPKREEVCKRFPISVVLALAASGGCRKRLNELGACQQLQKLVDGEVNSAKKALKMVAGSKLKNLFSLSWRD